MIKSRSDITPTEHTEFTPEVRPNAPRTRSCLRCQASFKSEWSGERVCPRCKSSHGWRTGIPVSNRAR